ncbi:hypothetical protein DEU56DRAFT_711161, partial [Suillus clintonianus]|uniref:uncharacterized protein n=1 Tax=Suillus clintonianus TaxID=1904413 RepID=UPI001B879F00
PASGPPPQDLPLPPQPSRSPSRPREFSLPPPDFSQQPQLSPPTLPGPIHEDPNGPDAEFTDVNERYYHTYHSMLNGRPCAADGTFLLHGTPPTPVPPRPPGDWSPYRNRIEFETAEFVFK